MYDILRIYSECQLAWFAYEPQTEDGIKVSAANSNQVGEGARPFSSGRLDKGAVAIAYFADVSTPDGEKNEDYFN